MRIKLFKYDYLAVGLIAFIYYLLLCAKVHTWLMVSGDSGDWLAGSIWWMNVQPYGSPLYVLLGHLLNTIPISDLVLKMTIGLSVIPASITVATTYLICKKLTNVRIALICALVLLGSAVFLTQATILEEYIIATMFVSLAFYFYIQGKKKLTILMLALGSAIHVIVMAISAIWLLIHIKEIKLWYKTFWIYLVVGILPYSMVLILMYLDTPRLLAGSLSLEGLNNYLGSTGTIGSLSLFEAPKRLLEFCGVIAVSFGLALIPIFVSFKGITKYGKLMLVASVTILFALWLYLTDSDSSTWTFLTFVTPLIMVFVAIGLKKLSSIHNKLVIGSACVLIFVNGVFLNANILANQYPLARNYENELRNLPDGSYVVCSSGGNYGLDNYYVMASGKDIRPIFINGDIPDINNFSDEWQSNYTQFIHDYLVNEQHIKDTVATQQVKDMVKQENDTAISSRYQGYLDWMSEEYGLQGTDTVQQVGWLLSQGCNVYLVMPTVTPYWDKIFKTESVTMRSVLQDGSEDITWDSKDNNFTDISKIVGINY